MSKKGKKFVFYRPFTLFEEATFDSWLNRSKLFCQCSQSSFVNTADITNDDDGAPRFPVSSRPSASRAKFSLSSDRENKCLDASMRSRQSPQTRVNCDTPTATSTENPILITFHWIRGSCEFPVPLGFHSSTSCSQLGTYPFIHVLNALRLPQEINSSFFFFFTLSSHRLCD